MAANTQPGSGPQGREWVRDRGTSYSLGPASELGVWGQAEGCVPQSSRALATLSPGQARALKQLCPLHSHLGSNGGAGLHGSPSKEASATGVHGTAIKCHAQLQPASVSPFTFQKLLQLRSAVHHSKEVAEVRVKLQDTAHHDFRSTSAGGPDSQRRALL